MEAVGTMVMEREYAGKHGVILISDEEADLELDNRARTFIETFLLPKISTGITTFRDMVAFYDISQKVFSLAREYGLCSMIRYSADGCCYSFWYEN